MTYGWTILVIVLITIGALAYLGILNPDRFRPEETNEEETVESELVGKNCSTVSPDSRDECCIEEYGTKKYLYDEDANECRLRNVEEVVCSDGYQTSCYEGIPTRECCERNGHTYLDSDLLDFTCNELQETFESYFFTNEKILISNIMILKDCELTTKEKYTGKCSEERLDFDYWFEKDGGEGRRVENYLERLKVCLEED